MWQNGLIEFQTGSLNAQLNGVFLRFPLRHDDENVGRFVGQAAGVVVRQTSSAPGGTVF